MCGSVCMPHMRVVLQCQQGICSRRKVLKKSTQPLTWSVGRAGCSCFQYLHMIMYTRLDAERIPFTSFALVTGGQRTLSSCAHIVAAYLGLSSFWSMLSKQGSSRWRTSMVIFLLSGAHNLICRRALYTLISSQVWTGIAWAAPMQIQAVTWVLGTCNLAVFHQL